MSDEHIRERVLDALVATLSGATDADTRVEKNALYLRYDAELPHINVIQGDESSDRENSTQASLYRFLVVDLVVTAKASSQVVRVLNNIERQIHETLRDDPQLGFAAHVIDTDWNDTPRPEVSGESDTPVASMISTWIVHYRTSYDDPSK